MCYILDKNTGNHKSNKSPENGSKLEINKSSDIGKNSIRNMPVTPRKGKLQEISKDRNSKPSAPKLRTR